MPAYPRKTQKVFGSGLVAAGNVAVWGSLAAGAPAYSNDPAVIQSLGGFSLGFNGAVIGNRSPAIEDMNALILLITQQVAYCLQSGIAEWDTDTVYFTGNFCRIGGMVYSSLSDDNTGNDPLTDTNNWRNYRESINPAASRCKAWVNFNGNNGTIIGAYNVAAVSRTAAGIYTGTFTTPLADANYAVLGTCGPSNGGSTSSPAGNNNHVSRWTVTSTTQFSVWIPKPDQLFGEDADLVSVLIF